MRLTPLRVALMVIRVCWDIADHRQQKNASLQPTLRFLLLIMNHDRSDADIETLE